MDGTRPGALSDSQLDRELGAALGVEPSPEFLARVRMKVATGPEPSTWRIAIVASGFNRMLQPQGFVESGFSRMLKHSVEPLWAAAIVGIVLAIVIPRVMRDERVPVRRVAAAEVLPAAADIPAAPEPPPISLRPLARPGPLVEEEWGRTVPLRLSPVLFADDDPKVFAMFVEAVGTGRVPEEAVRRPEERGAMEGLTIEPLEIAPLPSFARTAREGEDQWE